MKNKDYIREVLVLKIEQSKKDLEVLKEALKKNPDPIANAFKIVAVTQLARMKEMLEEFDRQNP